MANPIEKPETINADPEVNAQADASNDYVDPIEKPETINADPEVNAQADASNDYVNPIEKPETINADPEVNAQADASNDYVDPNYFADDPAAQGSSSGLSGAISKTQASAVAQVSANASGQGDWRVRLSLAPGATYLYKAPGDVGILGPLQATNGVIFPYTPTISVNYAANYDAASLVHTNYKMFQYTSSSVDSVTIACEFTCQDAFEANYLLAAIHFFRSMTKMFYGQDQNPKAGTPPPLCFMHGMGGYQFANHPLVINSFSYALPSEVDYIKTTAPSTPGANDATSAPAASNSTGSRLQQANVAPGGSCPPANFSPYPASTADSSTVTWVPTKIQLSISCYPIVSRNQVSNGFSLTDYATGNIYNGTTNPNGGFW